MKVIPLWPCQTEPLEKAALESLVDKLCIYLNLNKRIANRSVKWARKQSKQHCKTYYYYVTWSKQKVPVNQYKSIIGIDM